MISTGIAILLCIMAWQVFARLIGEYLFDKKRIFGRYREGDVVDFGYDGFRGLAVILVPDKPFAPFVNIARVHTEATQVPTHLREWYLETRIEAAEIDPKTQIVTPRVYRNPLDTTSHAMVHVRLFAQARVIGHALNIKEVSEMLAGKIDAAMEVRMELESGKRTYGVDAPDNFEYYRAIRREEARASNYYSLTINPFRPAYLTAAITCPILALFDIAEPLISGGLCTIGFIAVLAFIFTKSA